MKKIKLFVLFLSAVLLCGCQAKIDIVVDTNKNIEENIKITTQKEYVSDYFTSTLDFKENYESLLNQYDHNYKLDIFYKDNDAVGSIRKKSYLDKKNLSGIESLLIKTVNKKGNDYVLVLSNNMTDYFNPELEIDIDQNVLLDKIILNIQFHNVVTNANNNSYNSVTNTYTWVITEDNIDRNIEFTITNEKRYDIIIPYLMKKYIGYIILGTLIIGVTIFLLVIVYKSKRVNEI